MFLLLVYVVLAIGVSFACSIMEAVLLSVTPGHVAALDHAGHPIAPKLKGLKADIDQPLAAILSLNTIAHTVGAAGAGAQAAAVFNGYVGTFSAILTLAILFLSEIIPKTIGAVHWKRLTPSVTRLLLLIMPPLRPFVWMSRLASGLISSERGPNVSREEFHALANLGEEEGVLHPDESRILRALLRFRSLHANDIMTPRTVLFALPRTTTAGEAIEIDRALRFSRIPVYEQTIDRIGGYVLKDELLECVARDEHNTSLEQLKRDVLFVTGTTRVSELLEKFLSSREHIAIVIDEYGGTNGVVSLEDVVETLLDLEIVDEVDKISDLRTAARHEWLKRAKRLGLVDADSED